MPCITDSIVYSLMLVVNILLMVNYKDCKVPLDITMVILFASLLWVRLFYHVYIYHDCRTLAAAMIFVGVLVCATELISGLVFMILIETQRPKCVPVNLKAIDWVVLGVGNIFLLLSFFFLLFMCARQVKLRRELKTTKKKCDEAYNRIFDESFDLLAFIEEHGDNIDKEPFTSEELKLFNNNCVFEFEEDQSKTEESAKKECSICIQVFEMKEETVKHPFCLHLFHKSCIDPWMKNDLHCPLCKRGTRSSLLLHIEKESKTKTPPQVSEDL